MRREFLLCILAVVPFRAWSTNVPTEFPVANQGRPLCTVVCDPSAGVTERLAADELTRLLGRITHAKITLRITREIPPGNVLIVGHGAATASAFPDLDLSQVAAQECVWRFRHSSGHVGLIVGGSERGTLYAVYRLLNRLGVEWWTPWAEQVPTVSRLTLPEVDSNDRPKLEYRDPSFFFGFDPKWAAHAFANEAVKEPIYGGGTVYPEFVHTYYSLVDPKQFFATHPEWFSLIDGKRTAQDAQLCTSNPALRKFVLEQVRRLLRSRPDANIVSVSQNDCFNYCQCDRCQAIAKEQGSQAAPVLALANFVAEGIKDEFPNVAVDTLAYQWSRHAPRDMKPDPNVIVRLCSIECDFGVPLDHPKNRDFAADVLDWSRLTQRLYIWDYVTNFADYLLPMPDEAVLGPNLKFLSDHGVRGVFEEGDYSSNGGWMSELKGWMLGQLLWNPGADSLVLRNRFLKGYYGPAGEPIGHSIDLLDARAATTACTIFQDAHAPYLDSATLFSCEADWQRAEARVAHDAALLWRVKASHLALQSLFLQRWDELMKDAARQKVHWPMNPDRKVVAAEWLRFATSPGPIGWHPITTVSEDEKSPQKFIQSLH